MMDQLLDKPVNGFAETYPDLDDLSNSSSLKIGRRGRKKGKVKGDSIDMDNHILTDDSIKIIEIDSIKASQKTDTKLLNVKHDKGKESGKSWLDKFDDIESKAMNMAKKNNAETSWLELQCSDGDDDDDDDDAINLTIDNVIPSIVSEQCDLRNNNLNAYKSRFTFGHSSTLPDIPNADDQTWNNEKVVQSNLDSKIGININKWDRNTTNTKRDKFDGTKRSRRKTEPFDIRLQADGELTDILESINEISVRKTSNSLSWDIPGGLCNFMADDNDNTTRDLDGRNLLSGSISGKGLFVPFKNFDGGLSRENSLEKIFDENFVDDTEDLDFYLGSSDEKTDSDEEDDRGCESVFGALPPEPQLGNVEYKLKLVNPTKQRFEHLVTQMKWRLREGQGEALYEIGVRDCGRVRGLSPSEMKASLLTLRRMAARLGAACTLLGHRRLADTRRALAEVLVRKIPDDQHNIEVRVAVIGSNDAGKSTLVGVLTQGELDNGRGSARLNMFRHLHEVKTGRTSSVSHEILGFDSQGRAINYASNELMTSEEINERSSKLVSFIDLAGHRKYLKTTVQGLTGYSPHYAMLVVSAVSINQMTLEHLALLVALDLPFFVVVTKIDVTSFNQIVKQLEEELKAIGCRKVPISVFSMNDAVTAGANAPFRCIIPILPVSSVTGKGLDILRWFLFILPPRTTPDRHEQESIEFQVDETFKIGSGSYPVVGGLLKRGVLTENTKLLIGPLDNGDFTTVCVNSLHRNKVPCRVVRAGQAASLGLSWLPPGLRQGMFLLEIPKDYVVQEDNLPKTSKPISNKISPKFRKKIRKQYNIENNDLFKNTSKDQQNLDDGEYPAKFSNVFTSDINDSISDLIAERNADSNSDDDGLNNKCACSEECKKTDVKPIDDSVYNNNPDDPRGCYFFQASILLLNHSAPVYLGSQLTVHIGNIRQTAVVEGILTSDQTLRANESAHILFRFMRHPEYVRKNARILFREALHTKGIGRVTQVFPHKPDNSPTFCAKHSNKTSQQSQSYFVEDA